MASTNVGSAPAHEGGPNGTRLSCPGVQPGHAIRAHTRRLERGRRAVHRAAPALPHNVLRVPSRGLAREQSMVRLLTARAAQERWARLLLNFAERYQARGYSAREFVLRMTRWEIASFLRIKLCAVSRIFSSLQ